MSKKKYVFPAEFRAIQFACFISRVIGRNPGSFSPAQQGMGAQYGWSGEDGNWAVFMVLDTKGNATLELCEDADLADTQIFAIQGYFDAMQRDHV